MMKINLHKLISDRKLDRSELSVVLFPGNRHPSIALTRLLAGRGSLSESQIYRLSVFTGLSIEALYEEHLYWKKTLSGGLVRFSRDEFVAIYSPETGITKIYRRDSLMTTHVLSNRCIPISEYLSEINSIVNNKS